MKPTDPPDDLAPAADVTARIARLLGDINHAALADNLRTVRAAVRACERAKDGGASAVLSPVAPLRADLGPATEAAFAAAFRGRAVLTRKAAGRLLDIDVKTLKALTEREAIRATKRGNLDAYSESALRDYLTNPPPAPSAAAEPPKATRPKRTPGGRVYSFTKRHKQQQR